MVIDDCQFSMVNCKLITATEHLFVSHAIVLSSLPVVVVVMVIVVISLRNIAFPFAIACV